MGKRGFMMDPERAAPISNIDGMRGYARWLRDNHPTGSPSAEFIAFGMANEYLRAVVGNEWTNQMVFTEHTRVDQGSRSGRRFMRAEEEALPERWRNFMRTLRVAELLFNLKNVEGIEGRVEGLRSGMVEATYAELECGAFLMGRSIAFRYTTPTGTRGFDYDVEIPLIEGGKVNCELKCKAEETRLTRGAVLNPLNDSRKQLPAGEPGIVFFKIPEAWVKEREVARLVPTAVDGFLRGTSRVVAVVVRWEELYCQSNAAGAGMLYKYRVERGTSPKAIPSAVKVVLDRLAGPGTAPWVWFYSVAEQTMRGG